MITLLLTLLPAYVMLVVSVKNELQFQWQRYSVTFPFRLGNYGAAWEVISPYIWNTLFVAGVGLVGVAVLSLIGGHVFARMRFPFRETLFYALIAILMVPWIISFIPAYMLYVRLGLNNTWWGLILPNIAGGPVFGIFLMRAVIGGIPEELYESARCDGAGVWTEIWRISFPLGLPGLATLAVVNFLGSWNSYLWPVVMISERSKQMISVGLRLLSAGTHRYDTSMVSWGPVFAGYVIGSLPLVILFILLGKSYVEGLVESGIKT